MFQLTETQKANKTTFKQLLEERREDFELVLPDFLPADKLIKTAVVAMVQNPRLLDCSKDSILQAVMTCAELGLSPSPALGLAYLVPYGKKNPKAQLIPGWRGLVELAMKHPRIKTVYPPAIVYRNERCDVTLGDEPSLSHTPIFNGDRGDPWAAYCVAKMKNDEKIFVFMPEDEINTYREKSPSWTSDASKSFWTTDKLAAWKKTAVRRLCDFLPKSPELEAAVEVHDSADVDFSQNPPEIPRNENRTEGLASRLAGLGESPQDAEIIPPTTDNTPDEKTPEKPPEAPQAKATHHKPPEPFPEIPTSPPAPVEDWTPKYPTLDPGVEALVVKAADAGLGFKTLEEIAKKDLPKFTKTDVERGNHYVEAYLAKKSQEEGVPA